MANRSKHKPVVCNVPVVCCNVCICFLSLWPVYRPYCWWQAHIHFCRFLQNWNVHQSINHYWYFPWPPEAVCRKDDPPQRGGFSEEGDTGPAGMEGNLSSSPWALDGTAELTAQSPLGWKWCCYDPHTKPLVSNI